MTAHRFNAVRQLCGITFQKFAARGGAEKQLFNFQRGATVARCGAQLAAARFQQPAIVFTLQAREDGRLRDRCNSRQRFATKAHGAHVLQLLQITDFAGGMAAQRDGQLFAGNTAAVVFHADQAHAACKQANGNLRRTRIQRVIDQFAHDRGRAFHHLASGNLANQFIRKVLDGAALRRWCERGHRPHCMQPPMPLWETA